MNILIVGNGFDLSHYLPTKYDHFMDVMRAIEEKNTGEKVKDLSIHSVEEWVNEIDKIFEKRKDQIDPDYAMNFDELFSKTRESYFIAKTKEFYLTEQINLSAKDVFKLQYRLELNSWYQYFKKHVEEIKTWIDFEQKIESVIVATAQCIADLEKINNTSDVHSYLTWKSKEQFRIKEKIFHILDCFGLWEAEEYVLMAVAGGKTVKGSRPNINPRFCYGGNLENGLNPLSFLDFLQQQLEQFIVIFDLYLELVISQLNPASMLDIEAKEFVYPDKIYSFNYTNTYQRIHDSVEVEYLHGSHGEYQNIVLGVSDLEDESLKKIKAYGFTKYHQKLFKDTDYLFLDEYKKNIEDTKRKFDEDLQLMSANALSDIKARFMKMGYTGNNINLDLNFYIWGHSLDVSDKDYIHDLFSLNDDMDRNVRVIVYHFNKTAKFDLLNNLLAILGKDKVEHWMKNKWLQFKENPKIVPENAITLEDLPKM
ncbi:hypothetical protein CDG60_16355 [Acinetobacter chinensis]|uniref:Bacteriophage abortive infection AbiH n=1 Tax=Acinetobacter chinensis TaxID=2004650 RepID=A0A3B7M1F6_9GAMM|nr:AbiH family protein [Acinetobacter chinensis]AXY57994.1 hypothetical protein CDG60_16355 [Acinetobacter chinensis]